MSAINFAIAYRKFLERRDRAEREPDEPRPQDHGLMPTVDAIGNRIENPLAEQLRLSVYLDWQRDVILKVKAKGKTK